MQGVSGAGAMGGRGGSERNGHDTDFDTTTSPGSRQLYGPDAAGPPGADRTAEQRLPLAEGVLRRREGGLAHVPRRGPCERLHRPHSRRGALLWIRDEPHRELFHPRIFCGPSLPPLSLRLRRLGGWERPGTTRTGETAGS